MDSALTERTARFWAERLKDKAMGPFIESVSPVAAPYSLCCTYAEYLADRNVCARALMIARHELAALPLLDAVLDFTSMDAPEFASYDTLDEAIEVFGGEAWEHPAEQMRELALALGMSEEDNNG